MISEEGGGRERGGQERSKGEEPKLAWVPIR